MEQLFCLQANNSRHSHRLATFARHLELLVVAPLFVCFVLMSLKEEILGVSMRVVRSAGAILLFCLLYLSFLLLLPHNSPRLSAQTASSGSSISSNSGSVSWDFGPVVAGTVTNVGIQDVCPPAMCDNHDLTVILPSTAATFYKTNTAKLTLKYTWSSTVPTDLDIFSISTTPPAHCPDSPDPSSTAPTHTTLTVPLPFN